MWKEQVLVSPFPYEPWTPKHKDPFFHHDGCILDFHPCKNLSEVCGEISLNRETCATPQVLPVLSSHDSKDITHREAENFLLSTSYFLPNIFYDRFYVVGFFSDTWKPTQGKICGAVSQLQAEIKQAPCTYCIRMMKRMMLSSWQKIFGSCHIPLYLLPPPGQHE